MQKRCLEEAKVKKKREQKKSDVGLLKPLDLSILLNFYEAERQGYKIGRGK